MAALDSLYELKNVVPDLVSRSKLSEQDGGSFNSCTTFVAGSKLPCCQLVVSLTKVKALMRRAAWNAFWLPPLLVISKHCVNTCRDIRQRATSYLQRLLLSPTLLTSPDSLEIHLSTIFDRVLFPVLDELLKPQVYEGMAEARTRTATLLCKVFLQYVVRLKSAEVGGLFVKVLDKLERFMRGERDLLVRPRPHAFVQ